jgi:phosphohistidine phosphatase SixA
MARMNALAESGSGAAWSSEADDLAFQAFGASCLATGRLRAAMWRILTGLILGLSTLVGMQASAMADEAAAWAALRQGGRVALMRHADAPGGAGDPPGFRLDDCTTQRNLSARGREDAKAVGERLRTERVAVTKLLSSPWCRCVDTARLLNIGPVEIAPTFSNAFVLADRRPALTAGARAVVGAWTGPGTLLVVTHGANIQALAGVNADSGEIVVVEPRPDASPRAVGRIPVSRR